MKKYIVVHRKDENNVGDIASNPLQYFLKPDEYQTIDIVNLRNEKYPASVPIIVGGGGLIGNDFIGDSVRDILSGADKNYLKQMWNLRWDTVNPANVEISREFNSRYQNLISEYINKTAEDKSPRFIWGAGHNGDVSKKTKKELNFPNWLTEFNLTGIRDWDQGYNWVPCASCMHPALRKDYSIKNDIIFFEHKKQLLKDFGTESIPRFVNSGSNIEQTIELLGSANIILTNSYHGAYWGTLLKKRVVVIDPWSTKFLNFKHAPTLLEKDESWKKAIDRSVIFQSALSECVTANETFWNKIKSFV
jgi:hypothetical protein